MEKCEIAPIGCFSDALFLFHIVWFHISLRTIDSGLDIFKKHLLNVFRTFSKDVRKLFKFWSNLHYRLPIIFIQYRMHDMVICEYIIRETYKNIEYQLISYSNTYWLWLIWTLSALYSTSILILYLTIKTEWWLQVLKVRKRPNWLQPYVSGLSQIWKTGKNQRKYKRD